MRLAIGCLLFLSWPLASEPARISVQAIPAYEEKALGELSTGQIFQSPTGKFYMRVDPVNYVRGNPSHVLHGVPSQPPILDGPGRFQAAYDAQQIGGGLALAILLSDPPIYVLFLETGQLMLMTADTWCRLVLDARLSVKVQK